MSRDRFQALEWIGNNLPDNTIVLTNEAFANYIAWRRTLYTPVPVSEPSPWARRLSSEEIAQRRLSGEPSDETGKWNIVAVGPPSSTSSTDKILWQSRSGLEAVILRHDSN
jgi:hypothetical protein